MHRAMIPVLLLAAVALSTGVELPRPQVSGMAPAPIIMEDRSCEEESNTTECEALRKIICDEAIWMSENNQLETWKILKEFDQKNDDYSEYLKEKQDNYDRGLPKKAWNNYPIQFTRLEARLRNQFNAVLNYVITGNYENGPLPNIKMVYLRYKDTVTKNDKDFEIKPGEYETPSIDTDFNQQEKVQNNEPNEMTEIIDTRRKRIDLPVLGEKEIPYNLIFINDKGVMKKKLFSLWSRLRSWAPARYLPQRRHAFVLYGHDGALSAQTRAARPRPVGQPLRWG